MQRLLAWLVLGLLGGGCATSASRPLLRGPESMTEDSWQNGDDALSKNMRAIAGQLGGVGLTPGQEAFRGFLTAGARATHRLTLPAHSCVALIAIASGGVHDMDAALYSPDGDVLAVDSQPDAHPTIQVCTGAEAHTLYYALQVYEGAGSFLMAGFLGQQTTLDAASKLIGARPAVARLGNAEPDGPGRVASLREGLQRRGFQQLQAPLQVQMTEDQSVRVALPVEPGQCYTAAGFGLDGLQNVDLRVLDEEGVEVGRDRSTEQDAGVQFCADRRAEFAAELHDVAGAGNALLLLFRVDAASIGGASGLWLGERPLAAASTAPLFELVAEVTSRAARDGFKQGRTLRQGRITRGEVVAEPLALREGRCARVHAVGGPGMRGLELRAVDAGGRTVAYAEGAVDTTYVHVCAASARELSLEVHAAAGSGPFALTVHEASMASVAPAGSDEQVAGDVLQALRQARDLGYAPAQNAAARRLSLRREEPLSVELESHQARCLRAYLLSSDPTARARLVVAGKQVEPAPAEGDPIRYCASGESAPISRPLALRITNAGEGSADAWLMVLTRP
ncbi:MAG: hypothetical protein ACHQ53_18565 [Polyangiales bacterium]